MNLYDKIAEASKVIEGKINKQPKIGLILGSGLGELAEEIDEAARIPYTEIPHFPSSTVVGHEGRLVIGSLFSQDVIAMQGRFHFYEGYTMEEVTFPVRVMQMLGVEILIVTNACGGMNAQYEPGDFMIITDHLNMTGTNPLIGENDERLGVRFPDMSMAYDRQLIAHAEKAAAEMGIAVQKGVYAGITGPSYMTGQELIMLRKLGGDVVGMSTVPEVIVARHANMRVLGISCVTDMAIGEQLEGITHEQVVNVANQARPRFIQFMKQVIKKMP